MTKETSRNERKITTMNEKWVETNKSYKNCSSFISGKDRC